MYLYRNWSWIRSPFFITLQAHTVGLKKDSQKNVDTMILVLNSNEGKKWLDKESRAFHTLESLVLDKGLLKDLRQMALFKHTGKLVILT